MDSIVIDENDNVYVSGHFTNCFAPQTYPHTKLSDDFTFNSTRNACSTLFLFKYTAQGELVFVNTPLNPTINSLAMANTHSINMEMHNNTNYNFLVYLLKYNLDGSFISQNQIGDIAGTSQFNLRFKRNPNNGITYMLYNKVTPSQNTDFIFSGNTIVESCAVIALNENGQYLWHKANDVANIEDIWRGNRISVTNLDFDEQNNVYLLASVPPINSASFFGSDNPTNHTVNAVMKLNPNFTHKYWQAMSHYGNWFTKGILYHQPTNSVYYTVTSAGLNYFFGNQSIPVTDYNQGHDAIIAKFDAQTGSCNLLQNIISTRGSSDDERHVITVDRNNNIIIGGKFTGTLFDQNGNSAINPYNNTNYFIAKFGTTNCTSLSSADFNSQAIKLYPNPFQNSVKLPNDTQYKQVNIFNNTGALVKQFNNPSTYINTEILPSGIYLFQILDTNNVMHSFKMIKK